MASTQKTLSGKLHVVDRSTFDKIKEQISDSTAAISPNLRIRNSKYKKSHAKIVASCNLLQFLKRKPLKLSSNRGLKLRRHQVIDTTIRHLKKKGKTREGGKKRQYSRLKKSIMRYRQQKRRLEEATEQLETLSLHQKATEPETIAKIHSRRFRTYCNNCTTPRLADFTERLLRELDRFQRRAYSQNEIKARAHRRFVVGFREMQNYISINKVKLAIIAPDCEECPGEAGLDTTIEDIKRQCHDKSIPYLFSLRRRQLAYALYKKVPVSCVAVLDYDGTLPIFNQLVAALQEARSDYIALLQEKTPTAIA